MADRDVENLSQILFAGPTPAAEVVVTMGDGTGPRGLFLFLLRLAVQGLRIRFARGGGMRFVQERMLLLGVRCVHAIRESDRPSVDSAAAVEVDVSGLSAAHPATPVEQLSARLTWHSGGSAPAVHTSLSFELFHQPAAAVCRFAPHGTA